MPNIFMEHLFDCSGNTVLQFLTRVGHVSTFKRGFVNG